MTKPLAPSGQSASATRREKAPSHLSRDIALGIGGAGIGVSALAVGSNLESSSDGAYVFAGVALGIGVVGLATAGILTLTEDDTTDVASVRVRSTAGGLAVDF